MIHMDGGHADGIFMRVIGNGAEQQRLVRERFLALYDALQGTTRGATEQHAIEIATLENVGTEATMDICFSPTKGAGGCRIAVEDVKMLIDRDDGVGRIGK